jgi:transcriptional regulator with XRE-family HTH domain
MLASGMAQKETRTQQVARQLAALMERHGIRDSGEFERLIHKRGIKGIDQVTIRRLLQATAKTEPRATTLRLIAEAVGETMIEAFPEDETVTFATFGDRKIAFMGADGKPMTPRVVDEIMEALRRVPPEKAHEIHELKKPRKH